MYVECAVVLLNQNARAKYQRIQKFYLRDLIGRLCCLHNVFLIANCYWDRTKTTLFAQIMPMAPFLSLLFCATSFHLSLFSQSTNWKLHRKRERVIAAIAIPCVFLRLLNCTPLVCDEHRGWLKMDPRFCEFHFIALSLAVRCKFTQPEAGLMFLSRLSRWLGRAAVLFVSFGGHANNCIKWPVHVRLQLIRGERVSGLVR